MIKKILLTAITSTLISRSPNPIKTSIRNEVISTTLKIMSGLILVSLVVYALIELIQIIQEELALYQNGTAFQIIFFSAIIAISATIVWFLFKYNKNKVDAQTINLPSIPDMAMSFGGGIMEGFKLKSVPKNNPYSYSAKSNINSHLS